jgi:hypothetical protein
VIGYVQNEKPLVLKSRRIELKDRKLSEYGRQIRARIEVIKCLPRSVTKSEVKAAMVKEKDFKCVSAPKVLW